VQTARRRRLAVLVVAVAAIATATAVLGDRLERADRQEDSDGPARDGGADESDPATTATTADAVVPTGPPDQATLDALSLRLEPLVELQYPTAAVQRPGTEDLYVTGVQGPIVRVPLGGGDPVPVADFGAQVSTSGESGLLDLAFNPAGDLVYVSLVERDGDLALVEFPFVANNFATDRPRTLLTIESPTNVHHAGDVDVDADGLVWFAVGDGGPSQGRSMRAQDLNDLHGKILRIDPHPTAGMAYQIPADNPFNGRPDARPEVWAYGLRNPWRFDIDPVTGDLWIGDVGRNGPEELNYLPGPRAGAAANFGWPYFEGTAAGIAGAPPQLTPPLLDYPHGDRCGITGGSVYRGAAIPALTGAYLYSDLCDGIVRAVSVSDGAVIAARVFQDAQAGYPVSFGTDLAGELYLCSFDLRAVFRIVGA
jgi:glucose/arabinose dehydrogenase